MHGVDKTSKQIKNNSLLRKVFLLVSSPWTNVIFQMFTSFICLVDKNVFSQERTEQKYINIDNKTQFGARNENKQKISQQKCKFY